VFCQYGVVNPGFSAWRELAANIMVTDGVLAGETQSFPVLHHWRVLPGRSPVAAERADIDTVFAALDGCPSRACPSRDAGRCVVQSSAVLRIHPAPILDWLREDPADKATTVERQF
jgi:hypothetical protein